MSLWGRGTAPKRTHDALNGDGNATGWRSATTNNRVLLAVAPKLPSRCHCQSIHGAGCSKNKPAESVELSVRCLWETVQYINSRHPGSRIKKHLVRLAPPRRTSV